MPNSKPDSVNIKLDAIAPAEIEEIVGETKVTTNVVVEDRTDNPAADREVEFESEEIEHPNGTIETRYGEPVGGRPDAPAAPAASEPEVA